MRAYSTDSSTSPSGLEPRQVVLARPAHLTELARDQRQQRRVELIAVGAASSLQVSRRRPPVGTIFSYTLDIPAAVRFDFTQPASGRMVNGKCVALNKRNKRKPKCTLQPGSLSFAGHAGLNTVSFSGWLSHSKKLAPGNYTLVITAITPGVGATSQTLRFTIVR